MSNQNRKTTHCTVRACVSVICGLASFASLLIAGETNTPSSYERGVANIGSNDWETAITNFSDAINHNPKDALAYEYRGGAYFAKGDLDRAIIDFTRTIQLDAANARALCSRGSAYRAKHEYDKALGDLSASLRLNATNGVAYKSRASVYNVTGDFARAITDWNEGLRLSPNDATALAMRGFAFAKVGQYTNAVNDYTNALRLDPLNHPAYNDLAWLRATCPVEAMRNGKEAVREATKACELTGWTNWSWMDTLAAACAEADEFKRAVDYQKKGMNITGVTEGTRADMQRRLALYERQQPYHEEQN